jgi:hypothetical protein
VTSVTHFFARSGQIIGEKLAFLPKITIIVVDLCRTDAHLHKFVTRRAFSAPRCTEIAGSRGKERAFAGRGLAFGCPLSAAGHRPPQAAEKLDVLKGHEFTRAASSTKSSWHLGREGSFLGDSPSDPHFSAAYPARALQQRASSAPTCGM